MSLAERAPCALDGARLSRAPRTSPTGRLAAPPRSTPARLGPPTTRAGDDPSVLRAILEPGVNVVLWRRPLPPALARYCENEARGHAHASRRVLSGERPPVHRLLEACSLRDGRDALASDLAHVLRLFQSLLPEGAAQPVLGAFEVTDRDGCRKLHGDHVHVRLLCTYAGPATEWADDAHVNRRALVPSALSAAEVNPRIVRPEHLQRAGTGDVLLLKGHAWPGALGAVHRSPPIEATGERRALLTLTWVGTAAQTRALIDR